jgi:hypothetical protein
VDRITDPQRDAILRTCCHQISPFCLRSISFFAEIPYWCLSFFIACTDIIFDGKNIAEENIPRLLRWIPKVGLIRWGFEGLCVNEFEGLEFDTSGSSIRRGPPARTGVEALSRFSLGSKTVGDALRAQALVASAGWIISCLGLMLTGEKYMVMKTPSEVGLPSTNENTSSKKAFR